MERQDSLLIAEEEEEGVAVLRYEGQITELLVVIAELNRKIDRLTEAAIREDDEYLDTCSDLSDSNYLEPSPCLCPDQGQPADVDCPGQPGQTLRVTGEPCDLSRTLHRVLTELEDAARARKAETPHCRADPGEEEEAALAHWELVTQADDLLSCLRSVQQSATFAPPPSLFTSIVGTITARPGTISNECEALVNRDPGSVVERLIRSFQECSSLQELSRLLHAHGSNVTRVRIRDYEMDAEQLRIGIDKWKGRNDLLAAVLQECKGDCERLSMLLGKHESNGTALRLALQYSEDCLEVYELFLAMAESKGSSLRRQLEAPGDLAHWRTDRDGGFGSRDSAGKTAADAWTAAEKPHGFHSPTAEPQHQVPSEDAQYSLSGEPGDDDVATRLRGDVTRLRLNYTAVRQTILELGDTPPHLKRYHAAPRDGEAGSGSCEIVPAAQGLVLPGFSSPAPGTLHRHRMGKTELLHDLATVREEMSWLKGRLSWVKKERRGLEQSLRSQERQEEAAILLLAHWQTERDEWLGQQPSADCVKEETASGASGSCSDKLVSELTAVSTREKQLRDHIEELVTSLEKLIDHNNNQKEQSEELSIELRKTHSNLSTAYRSAKKKYNSQLSKLESQVATMSERQGAQVQALEEKATRLQEELDYANGTPL